MDAEWVPDLSNSSPPIAASSFLRSMSSPASFGTSSVNVLAEAMRSFRAAPAARNNTECASHARPPSVEQNDLPDSEDVFLNVWNEHDQTVRGDVCEEDPFDHGFELD